MTTVFVAGHHGMVGSALVRQLQRTGADVLVSPRHDLDLTETAAVQSFFSQHQIDQVYLAAARVGGIMANQTQPADFILQNLMIQNNVISAAAESNVSRLLFLGSSCIYPRSASQPIAENALLTGPLEPTNEPYAIAKIAGIKLCESYNRQHGCDFRCVMPTNLYGPGDRFDAANGHVIPALMMRFYDAILSGGNELVIWGSGRPRREFLHVDDLASACVQVMSLSPENYRTATQPMQSQINVGSGEEVSIARLAAMLQEITGYRGELIFDDSYPDGAPRKLLDSSLLESLGWQPSIALSDGLKATWGWYVATRQAVS